MRLILYNNIAMPNIRENKSTEKNDFIINVHNLTKDYGSNRGIFGVNLQVKKGEVYGYLGPNGAGKTTTIRHIMGFQHPQNPKDVSINSKRI
jgi:ABC-type multidrug transport system ATPase subunit